MSGNYISKWLLNVYLSFELFINDIVTVISTRKQSSAGVVTNLYSGGNWRKLYENNEIVNVSIYIKICSNKH